MAYKTPTTQTGKKLYQKENEGREENELSPEVRMAQKTCSRETPHGSRKTAPLLTDRGPRTETQEKPPTGTGETARSLTDVLSPYTLSLSL